MSLDRSLAALALLTTAMLLSLSAGASIDSSQVPGVTDVLVALGGSYTQSQVASITCDDFSRGVHGVTVSCSSTGLALSLSVVNQTGSLSASISQLVTLTQLTIRLCVFSAFPITDSLAALTCLQKLAIVSISSPPGSLPASLGSLTALTSLQINDVYLDGSLPPTVSSLTNLASLDVGVNNLTGIIPDGISSLRNLQSLQMDLNSLTGGIPPSVLVLQNLTALVLSHNPGLGGRIPESITNLTSLAYLYLRSCNLIGSIPASVTRLTSLRRLILRSNYLTGPVPAFKPPSLLQYLDAGDNPIDGAIPASYGRLPLVLVDLSDGNLTGTIPASLGGLKTLEVLILEDNSLEGSIPDAFASLASLVYLRLDGNRFNGSIPAWLGGLSLTYLSLSFNRFVGSIPASLGNLNSLLYLQLSYNFLSGSIPDTFSKLRSLVYLDLSVNALSGTLPRILPTASPPLFQPSIILSNNYLTGVAALAGCNPGSFDLSANCLARTSPCLNPSKNDQRTPTACRRFCRAGVWASPGPACAGLGTCTPSLFDVPGGSHFFCSKCAFPTTSLFDPSTCAKYKVCTTAPQSPCPKYSILTAPCPIGTAGSCCCCPNKLPYPTYKVDASGRKSIASCTNVNPM